MDGWENEDGWRNCRRERREGRRKRRGEEGKKIWTRDSGWLPLVDRSRWDG
jgi:hypothetical protein